MALGIKEQPHEIAYARTPVLYLVLEGTAAIKEEDSFQYIADVYLWQGLLADKPADPEYSLRKPPNTSGGEALFDIRNLATDWLITPEFDIGADANKTKEMYVWATVEFRWIYVATDGEVVELPKGDGIYSNSINIYNGYNYYMEGLNYERISHFGNEFASEYQERIFDDYGIAEAVQCIPTDLLGVTGEGYWMTDAPRVIDIPLDTSMYKFLLNHYDGSDVTSVVIDINNGEQVEMIDLLPYNSNLMAIGAGTKEMVELFGADASTLKTYKIYGADFRLNYHQVTFAYIFNVVEPCKYGFTNLQFLNRYGVWDNLLCYGAERSKLDVSREETMHSPLEIINSQFNFLKPFGEYHSANVHGRESVTMNTGWIGEEWNEVLAQLMMTQFLYDADSLEPYTLETKNLSFKTSLNDGLINYTLKLKKAYNQVNTVS